MKFSSDEILDSERDTWQSLLQRVRELENLGPSRSQWIFRALGKWEDKWDQRDGTCKPHISSSFDDAWWRPFVERPEGDRTLYESWMLFDFKREAYNYLALVPERTDFLEWLALARHYGMPSRLVDFTYSFYVASYLALATRYKQLDNGGSRADEDGCILAVNITWMKTLVENKLRSGWLCVDKDKDTLKYDDASFHDPRLFRRFAFKRPAEDFVVPVAPFRRNPRLARQQALFLCPGNIESGFDANLTATLGGKKDVKRLIRLRPQLRSEAIRDLLQMNVSLATLYPDLSGWAQSRGDLIHRDIHDERFRLVLRQAIDNPTL